MLSGLTLAFGASCVNPGDMGKGTGGYASSAPANLSYSANPVRYRVNVAITANEPSYSGAEITSWSISPELPAGLSFDTSTGVITGTPTDITSMGNYTVTATSAGGSNFMTLRLAVVDRPPTMTYGGSTSLTYDVGTPITTITPTLGGGSTTACVSDPELPDGISLSSACVITGVPTVPAALTTYSVTAVNSGGEATIDFNILVRDIPPTLSYTGSPWTFTRGSAISSKTPTNTGGAITSCSSSPSLPTGLSLSSGCVISGTPTALSGATAYTITATNSGGSVNANVTISVVDIAPIIAYSGGPFVYTKGTAISALSVTSTGGTITSCTAPGGLPAGLSVASNCKITGTPTAVSAAANYTITATNSAGSANATPSIQVKDIPPTISISGSPFEFTNQTAITAITPTLGGGAVTGCSSSPSLPTGLSIDNTTCVISGTPTGSSAAANYVITATNSGGSASKTINIRVKSRPPSLSYAGSPYTMQRATAIASITPTNTGDTATSCVSDPSLPSGLSLSASCRISGTPTAVTATDTYTITGSNAEGSDSVDIDITVNDLAPAIAYAGSPFTLTRNSVASTIQVTNTGGTITGCTAPGGLPAGLSVDNTTCSISGTPTTLSAATDYTITATNSGGSANATVNIAVIEAAPSLTFSASSYTLTKDTVMAAITPSNTGGTIVSCASSPGLPATLSLDNTTCEITGTPNAVVAGALYTITATNTGGTSSRAITITINDAVPTISYSPASYAYTKGSAIADVNPTTGGGAITGCTVSPSLPTGLSLSGACVLSGTPTQVRAQTDFTVTASNTGGSASAVLTLTVDDVLPSISYAGSPYTYTKGSAIATLTPTNTGGAITSCSISPSLPGGLSLSSACVLTGTPTAVASQADYTVSAVNSGGTATTSIRITVNDVAPTITYAGSPFSYDVSSAIAPLTPTTGGGTITSCSSSPSLPAGLSLSSTCVLSGTPTAPAAATDYTITATNSGGSDSDTINITVDDVPPSLTYTPNTFTFTQNVAITAKVPANSGGTVTSCSAPTLPAGLSVSSTCVISGTPTALSGATAHTITGTNTGGNSMPSVTITVVAAVPSISYAGGTNSLRLRRAASTISATNVGGTPVTCTAAGLPAGLSINNTTCAITGTPTVTSTATDYTVTATNTGGSANATVRIEVKDQPQILFYGLTALDGSVNGTAPLSKNVWKVSADGTDRSKLTQNSAVSLDSIYPMWRPNGTLATFSSLRATDGTTNGTPTSSYNVWKSSATGTSPGILTANTAAGYDSDHPPVFSPSGNKIAFVSKTALDGSANGTATSSYNIWIMNFDGTVKQALTQNTNAAMNSTQPVWSPDGGTIYFVSDMALGTTSSSWNVGSTAATNIWKVNVSTLALTALTSETVAGRDNSDPAVSPDGTSLVYTSKASIGGTAVSSSNIWKMNASDGTGKVALTANTAAALDSKQAQYSPDGSEIVFVSKMDVSGVASSSFNVFTMTSAGASQVALTTNTAASKDSAHPQFSTDNLSIVFESLQNVSGNPTTSSNIWVMDSDGTDQTALTTNTAGGLGCWLAPAGAWYSE